MTCFLSEEIYQAISPIWATHILSAEKHFNCMCVWLLISPSLLITNHYHSKTKVWTMKSICYWPAWTQRDRLKTECPTPETPEAHETMPQIPRETHWALYSQGGLMYSFFFFIFFSLGCRSRSSVRIKGWARLWSDRNDVLPQKKERIYGGLCSEEGPWMDTEKWHRDRCRKGIQALDFSFQTRRWWPVSSLAWPQNCYIAEDGLELISKAPTSLKHLGGCHHPVSFGTLCFLRSPTVWQSHQTNPR